MTGPSTIGRVTALTRFPVKSMAGEPLEEAELGWTGLAGDRRYSFLRSSSRSHFPWLTGREVSSLVRHAARYQQPDNLRHSPVQVTDPAGDVIALDDPALAARLAAEAGEPVALMHLGRGAFDSMPVSLVTTGSLARLDAAHGAALDARRFRINIVIESEAEEAAWQSRRIGIGAVELMVSGPAPRCAMVTICPDTARRDATVLRTVAQQFGNALGIYAATARCGPIRLGDAVRLLD
jgi:uncharacterized protein YcbX